MTTTASEVKSTRTNYLQVYLQADNSAVEELSFQQINYSFCYFVMYLPVCFRIIFEVVVQPLLVPFSYKRVLWLQTNMERDERVILSMG